MLPSTTVVVDGQMASLTPEPYTRPHSAASFVFDLPVTERAEQLSQRVPRNAQTPASNFSSFPDGDAITASYLVVSGGTGCNSICSAFGEDVCYVLPVSDNGGSSSEIIRVLGSYSFATVCNTTIQLITM